MMVIEGVTQDNTTEGLILSMWDRAPPIQETRWKGHRAEERNGYKLLYSGSDGAKNGVGFLVSIELHKNVIEVIRHND